MRILIYTGKGGVGKTSIAAATAVSLARAGRRTLVMSTDLAHSLADSLDQKLGFEPTPVFDGLDALEIDPARESTKAWGNLRDYLRQIISDKANGGIAADEVLQFPGLDELFSLLKILDIYESGIYDTIVVDCAPTGETLSLLRYPERLSVLADKLLPSVRSMNKALGGLISRKTAVPKPRDVVFEEFDILVKRLVQLQGILRDRDLCSMRIVTTPERIVLDEARRSYTWIHEYDFGVDAVYVNKIYPEEALQGYFSGWTKMQSESLKLAGESFGACRLFTLMLQDEEIRGIERLTHVGELLYGEQAPDAVFCREQAFRMEDEEGTRIFIVTLPYASEEDIAVSKEGEDLILVVRNQTRRFHLPDKVRRRNLTEYSFENGELRIRFDYD
jgi:arsenite-transporting ATPase